LQTCTYVPENNSLTGKHQSTLVNPLEGQNSVCVYVQVCE